MLGTFQRNTAATPVDEDLLENHRLLNDLCHKLDKTRFTTMANVFMQETDSPLLEIPDVNSYNLYFGWYLGELEQNDEFFDEYHAKYRIVVSDFLSMVQTLIHSTRAQIRLTEIILRLTRQYIMSIC